MLRSLSAVLLAATFTLPAAPVTAQQAPKTGREVVEKMYRKYKDSWYKTLTFVQTTTVDRGSGPTRQTWYETVASPSILRIDIGPPDSGNGVIYTVDSIMVVRGGKVAARRAGGNPFLPLIQGVYVQPVERTLADLAKFKFDVSKTMTVGSGDSLAWVVGTSTPGDTLSPQFWVEPKRLIVTRFIGDAGPNFRVDAWLGGYQPVGKAWLATKVKIVLPNGTQEEEYQDWKANRALPSGFFDPERWMEGPHWAREGL